MTADDWAGIVIGVIGAALLLNVLGCSRGLAEIFAPLKQASPWFFATTPRTTWQWRAAGAGLVLFGVLIVAFGNTS